jgi:hypothetical protein
VTMFCLLDHGKVTPVTTTATGMTAFQVKVTNLFFSSAIASTKPERRWLTSEDALDNQKSSKPFTSQINKVHTRVTLSQRVDAIKEKLT